MPRARLINWDRGHIPKHRKRGLKLEPARPRDICDPFPKARLVPDRHWEEESKRSWHREQRDWYAYVLDQDGVGSCAAESADGSVAALAVRQGLPPVVFNPWGTYHYTSGGSADRGSNIGDNMVFKRERGCFPEEDWPRSKGWRATPPARSLQIAKCFRLREFFRIQTINEFVSALLQGMILHAGYSGHAVSFCGYQHPGRVVFMNSWGNWGDKGFGTLALNKIYFPYGAYAYEDVIPYAEPDGDGWNWHGEWQPTVNQLDLAVAVERYQRATLKQKRRRFDPSKYAACVAGCRQAT